MLNMATITSLSLGDFYNMEVSPVQEVLWNILIHGSGMDNDKKTDKFGFNRRTSKAKKLSL